MTGTAIVVEGLRLDRGPRTILSGVDLEARPGELVALVGPNGAGKSTLLGAISGDLEPAAGRVLLGGRPVGDHGLRELARIRAVLTQRLTVDFAFRSSEVIAMGGAPWDGADPQAVHEAVETCDVAHLLDRPIHALSGGEQARVHMARVLVQSTPVLLLDEPTAAMDLRHTERILGAARAHADGGGTVVVVLHDLSAAAAWADRVVVLACGGVRACGPPDEALTEDIIGEVYGQAVEILRDSAGRIVVTPRRPAPRVGHRRAAADGRTDAARTDPNNLNHPTDPCRLHGRPEGLPGTRTTMGELP